MKYRKNSAQRRQATIAAQSQPCGRPWSPTVNDPHEQLDDYADYDQGWADAIDNVSVLIDDLLTDINEFLDDLNEFFDKVRETLEMEIDAGKDVE
jgi:hypothetical protein